MDPDRERRAADVFKAALALGTSEREPFVARQCGEDESLCRNVQSLLKADGAAERFFGALLPSVAIPPAVEEAAQQMIGRQLGRYRVTRLIAVGGMGAVYEAAQDQPNRIVALKVMRHGIASRSAVRRFDHESQILARLHHPAIAQVYDVGLFDGGPAGRPYFVMEYIEKAQTIIDYAGSEDLGTQRRLDLFITVCEAVQHGHQKGVIHRDLKPDNILVDATGQVKIIDFGVARATDSDVAVTTMQTDIGQLIGTVAYMSPEQVEADPRDLDVRSDVYSLGVVLYELLCGSLPYDMTAARVYEATRIIREQAPTPPSSIDRALRGDLETIVLKALEKDRERRYQSAADLGADIRRYLSSNPIMARPASTAYQLRTFAKRNKALVGGIGATFLVLVAGVLGMSGMYLRARAAEADAKLRAEQLEQEIAFKEEQFASLDTALRFATIRNRGQAAAFLRDALESRREVLGDTDELTLDTMMNLGIVLVKLDELDEAELLLREAVRGYRLLGGEDDARAVLCTSWLGTVRQHLGRLEEAERLGREATEHARRLLSNRPGPARVEALTIVLSQYARTLMLMNRFQEAEAVYLERFAMRESPGGRAAQLAAGNLARLYDRWHEAEPDAGHAAQVMKWRSRMNDFASNEGARGDP